MLRANCGLSQHLRHNSHEANSTIKQTRQAGNIFEMINDVFIDRLLMLW